MNKIEQNYEKLVSQPSDLQEHDSLLSILLWVGITATCIILFFLI